jgi:hypothetical protein
MAQHRLWARRGFYRRGRLRKLEHVRESPVGVELVLECRNFCLRVGLPLWPLIHKMATLLLYHSPIFSLIMMGIGAEDQELRQTVGLWAASCWQGALYGTRSSDSCVLVGAHIAVLWAVLERLISLEVQLVKFLISNSRHAVWYKGGSLRIGEKETQALGWALARRSTVKCCSLEDSKHPPTPFSVFLTVPWELLPLGDPIVLDSRGCCENDQMRAGPSKSQW